MFRCKISIITLGLFAIVVPGLVLAHGEAGKRFFPATLTVEDPFVADEADILLSHNKFREDGSELIDTTAASFDYFKTITSNFGFSIGKSYLHLVPEDGGVLNGFDNTEIGIKYAVAESDKHELLLAVALNAELGGTGSRAIDANPHTELFPTALFGKGLGDLSPCLNFLRPFTITGAIGPGVDTHARVNSVEWGLTVQYSIKYLQSYVQNVGLPEFFNHLIPIVEFPMSTCTNGECSGHTVGTINPGFILYGKYMQLGLEAAVPVNHHTGKNVGVFAQIHFYLDNIFPNSLGRPIFT